MKKIIFSQSLLAVTLFTLPAKAIDLPNGECPLIVASRITIAEVHDYINVNISDRRNLKVYKAQNGWYAISIGELKPNEVEPVIRRWKNSGKIPQDSFCAAPDRLVYEVDWGVQTDKKPRKTMQNNLNSSHWADLLTPAQIAENEAKRQAMLSQNARFLDAAIQQGRNIQQQNAELAQEGIAPDPIESSPFSSRGRYRRGVQAYNEVRGDPMAHKKQQLLEAAERKKEQLGYQAQREEEEDKAKLNAGMNPEQVAQERQESRALDALSPEERLQNYEAYKKNEKGAVRDRALIRAVDTGDLSYLRERFGEGIARYFQEEALNNAQDANLNNAQKTDQGSIWGLFQKLWGN